MPFGLFNIHKPAGPTSHQIVAGVRQGLEIRRVGHAGTLDPLAEGVLVVAVGQATRLTEYLLSSDKEYIAEVTLGIQTDSYDAEGVVLSRQPVPAGLDHQSVDVALDQFRGEISQVPPVYSSIKIRGKTAHSRARSGEHIILQPRPATIYLLELLAVDLPIIRLRIECSSGTYIRSIANDLGKALGCGGMLTGLIRAASGQFRLEDSIPWHVLVDSFERNMWQGHLISARRVFSDWPAVELDEASVMAIANGMPISRSDVQDRLGCAYTSDGSMVAILQGKLESGLWYPVKVFKHNID
nr:tRNA pseudouridine(55) synthase TruB [Anaerolineae bacterium]